MVMKLFWIAFALGCFSATTRAEPVSVSVKMVCIPEVSGGVRKSTNNQWSNVKFSVNDGDRFSIVFDALKNHSPKNQEICKNAILGKGDSLTKYQNGFIFYCGIQTYFSDKNKSHAELCSLSGGGDNKIMRCDDWVLDLKNGNYIANDIVSVTYGFGYASVTKGVCTDIP
jgi:hypothetical protein